MVAAILRDVPGFAHAADDDAAFAAQDDIQRVQEIFVEACA
jgi:hypothetical protein